MNTHWDSVIVLLIAGPFSIVSLWISSFSRARSFYYVWRLILLLFILQYCISPMLLISYVDYRPDVLVIVWILILIMFIVAIMFNYSFPIPKRLHANDYECNENKSKPDRWLEAHVFWLLGIMFYGAFVHANGGFSYYLHEFNYLYQIGFKTGFLRWISQGLLVSSVSYMTWIAQRRRRRFLIKVWVSILFIVSAAIIATFGSRGYVLLFLLLFTHLSSDVFYKPFTPRQVLLVVIIVFLIFTMRDVLWAISSGSPVINAILNSTIAGMNSFATSIAKEFREYVVLQEIMEHNMVVGGSILKDQFVTLFPDFLLPYDAEYASVGAVAKQLLGFPSPSPPGVFGFGWLISGFAGALLMSVITGYVLAVVARLREPYFSVAVLFFLFDFIRQGEFQRVIVSFSVVMGIMFILDGFPTKLRIGDSSNNEGKEDSASCYRPRLWRSRNTISKLGH